MVATARLAKRLEPFLLAHLEVELLRALVRLERHHLLDALARLDPEARQGSLQTSGFILERTNLGSESFGLHSHRREQGGVFDD